METLIYPYVHIQIQEDPMKLFRSSWKLEF